jgi:Bacterial archaeo-eukaryotic release factor family 10
LNSQLITELRELIDERADGPVLSAFCRTDPRDPANKGESPGWLVALKNGLRDAVSSSNGEHEGGEAARKLGAEAERRLTEISAAERGRSVALFLSADGLINALHTFQIPVREDFVCLDGGPVIWPMVDVLDRGRRTGLVLISHDRIRLLEWRDGHAEELETSTYDLELGDWREYRGASRSGHGQSAVSHERAYDDRVAEWRARFIKAAGKNISEGTRELGFERLLVAGEGDLGREFTEALPSELRGLVAEVVPTNLIDLSPAEAAQHLDPHMREVWRARVNRVADDALERVQAGGRGAGGADETLLALAEGRVEHLLIDPYLKTKAETLSDGARQAIEDAGEASIQEALVELAIRTDAQVSSASVEEVPALAEAGGVLALLRY